MNERTRLYGLFARERVRESASRFHCHAPLCHCSELAHLLGSQGSEAVDALVYLVVLRHLLHALHPCHDVRERRKVDQLEDLELVELAVRRQVCETIIVIVSCVIDGNNARTTHAPASVSESPTMYCVLASPASRMPSTRATLSLPAVASPGMPRNTASSVGRKTVVDAKRLLL